MFAEIYESMAELFSDEFFMNQALAQAKIAYDKDEVPVGAVIVFKNQIIARAHNLTEILNDPTAHAEMQALTAAADAIGAKYLNDCTLYVTVEPCVMCAGAAYWAQLGRIVFGADDNKRGYRVFNSKIIHPQTEVKGGVMRQECAELMTGFFYKLRTT
jgi:tRNA(adenine34) deaminase